MQIIEREHAQHIAELLRIPMYEIQSSSHDELKNNKRLIIPARIKILADFL